MLTPEEKPLKDPSTIILSINNFGNLSKGVKKVSMRRIGFLKTSLTKE